MAHLMVHKSGPLTLVQDWGRAGVAHLGISEGGPMDEHAFCWANHLLDNAMNASMLEITLGNAEIAVDTPMTVAVTGADLGQTLNGAPVAGWQRIHLQPGDRLKFHKPVNGLRAYLAVPGGFALPAPFGSQSCVARHQMGGVDGRACRHGDLLTVNAARRLPWRAVSSRFVPDYHSTAPLGVILGYQASLFSGAQLARFFGESYRLSPRSDRMGMRLEGGVIEPPSDGIISEAIALGAIQVPPDGQPIILGKDRQTLGGYAKLGVLARRDFSRLSQLMPGQAVRFNELSLAEAGRRWQRFARFFGV